MLSFNMYIFYTIIYALSREDNAIVGIPGTFFPHLKNVGTQNENVGQNHTFFALCINLWMIQSHSNVRGRVHVVVVKFFRTKSIT